MFIPPIDNSGKPVQGRRDITPTSLHRKQVGVKRKISTSSQRVIVRVAAGANAVGERLISALLSTTRFRGLIDNQPGELAFG